jgi:hypothetical protein
MGMAEGPEDAAVFLMYLPRVSSELKIVAPTQKALAAEVWNSSWDVLLLGALFGCEVGENIESESPSTEVKRGTVLRSTNHYFHAWRNRPHMLSEADCAWLESNFSHARNLNNNFAFQSAVHCMASFHWHPHPRPRLALLWAGIEGLFGIESELSFRLSLLSAKFLEPDDSAAAREVFKQVKDLYKARSKAVHGSEMKGDANALINDSATLLKKLLRRCVECQALPDSEGLVL